MRDKSQVAELIRERRIIAIIRASDSDQLLDVTGALLDGGIPLVEISMTTPDALQVISQASRRFGSDLVIGAGTVLDTSTASEVIRAGAEFILSPVFNRDVIALCRRKGVIVIPGCFTPSEILDATEAGGDFIKVFPTSQVGPGYIKAVMAPLPHVDLIAVGGVDKDNASAFLDAGCVAVGVGSSLVTNTFLESNDMAGLTALTREFVSRISR